MDAITVVPLGIIHTPFTILTGMPIQSVAARGVAGWIELDPVYADGLRDLDGFEYLILIYQLHQAGAGRLTVTPFLDDQPHGVFATRSPRRPNALGLSVVRLVAIQGTRLDIEDVDMLDGTPLLDIKPYVPIFDVRATERIGWFAGKVAQVYQARSDDRFT
jgi:tRNA-Thr(GGU) m(6)t(6)A37 methyltransferase TsaA